MQITRQIIAEEELKDSRAHYLAGSVSTLLRLMVHDAQHPVKIDKDKLGPRGGQVFVYSKKQKP